MQGFNKVILAGNITRDPQLKYLPNNMAVCEFGLAMNRRWRDKDGNQHEDVCFVDVAAFGRQGETINQYMAKGKSILVEGRLKLDQWDDKETGQKRNKLKVHCENMTMLGSRQEGGGGGGRGSIGPAAHAGDGDSGGNYDNQEMNEPPGGYEPSAAPSGGDVPF